MAAFQFVVEGTDAAVVLTSKIRENNLQADLNISILLYFQSSKTTKRHLGKSYLSLKTRKIDTKTILKVKDI